MQPTESATQFPKKADKQRLQDYGFYDKLYSGDHFDAFSIKGEKGFSEQYNRLRYIAVNFAGIVSRTMADMLFGEEITIDLESVDNQNFIDGVIEQNQLITQLYESALANSRRGDSVFKMRIGQRNPEILTQKSTIIIEEINPAIYFPQLDQSSGRYQPKEDVLAWTFEQNGVTYLHKETHKPGYIFHEIFKYDAKSQKIISQEDPTAFGFLAVEETGVQRSLIFHIPNVRDGNGFFGTSDYKDLVTLFFALNNRITKTDNILDKHSDPILAVPPGVLDENGDVKKEALGMFEVDNESGAKPEYIVWNANLESGFTELEKLIELAFMVSEIAPATMGMDKDGQAESGRALKFKLLATIRKRNRKKRYYDQAIKDMLMTAQELAIANGISINDNRITKAERPTIDWGLGIINDETEQIDNAVKRVDAGLSSRADEIAKLDGKTPDEAKQKVKEIDEESAPDVTPLTGDGDQDQGGGAGNAGGSTPVKQKPNTAKA